MEFLENYYVELSKNGKLPALSSMVLTSAVFTFNHNIARAIMLPTLTYGPDSDDDWAHSDSLFLLQAAITQIVTSLETYYQFVFKVITQTLKTSEVDAVALSHFVKGNKFLVEFTNAIEKSKSIDFCLCEISPKYYSFQDREKIKLAMNLLGLDPIGKNAVEWANTFGDNPDSTASLRHVFVHNGSGTIQGLSRQLIHDRINDAIVLANSVDSQVVAKYKADKYPNLYPQRP